MRDEITLFRAINGSLAGEDILVKGEHLGLLTYGKKGLHIWHDGLYHKIREEELKKTKFYSKILEKDKGDK